MIKAAGGVLSRVGEAIDDLLKGHNNLATPLGVNLDGSDLVPANVVSVQAQHLGNGLVDVSIVDNSSIVKGINYHIEYALADPSGNPNFTNPRGATMGPWRNGTILLPNGLWYLRAYSQYPAGGPPSTPVLAQGPIHVTGSSSQPLYPSQASGTGTPSTGGGHGAGKTVSR